MSGLSIWGVTDTGRRRECNEDAIAWDEEHGYAILADGVGGQNAGEVASGMVVSVMEQRLRADADADPQQLLAEAVEEANRRINGEAAANPLYRGMGSTVVAAVFRREAVTVAHVGDSRLYRYRAGVLEQLTRDHSLVQELVDEGIMSAEDARDSCFGNVITRALGSAPEVQVDVSFFAVLPGDCLLLCSDGLSDLASDSDIADILARHASTESAALDLVALANARGGNDNISVILADIS
jgi:protein phosphatase